jgi:hypothetical protein
MLGAPEPLECGGSVANRFTSCKMSFAVFAFAEVAVVSRASNSSFSSSFAFLTQILDIILNLK